MIKIFKDLKSNILNLVILLVVVCVIYLILEKLSTDNYQGAGSDLVTNLESVIGVSANGYSIQSVQSQKYLTHSTDDSTNPLYFDAMELKNTVYKSINYDMCKFQIEPTATSSTDGIYYIKSSGPLDPRVGNTYISSESQYGLKNPRPNISSSVEANTYPNGTGKFEIKTTSGDNNVFLINSQQYKIKPYVPDMVKEVNEYNLKYSFERHNNVENNMCNGGNNILNANDTSSTTINDCAKKCDNNAQCSNFQYYYKPNANADANAGSCYIYKKCSGDAITTGGENSVIYDKSDIRAQLEAERENKYRILGVKNKNFENLKKLIDDNQDKAIKIKEKIDQINSLKQYPDGHSQRTINEHKEILDLIQDPSRIQDIKYKIEQDIQDTKICGLEKQISELEELKASSASSNPATSRQNQQVKGIKSYDNSQILNVYPGKESVDGQPDNYMIFGNGGCLAYNQVVDEKDVSTNQYAFTRCNVQNDQQQFNIKNIRDKNLYNNNVYSNLNQISIDIGQPFNIIKPVNTNSEALDNDREKQCLALNDKGVTIEPCNLDPEQRFSIVNTVTAC